MTVKLIFVVLVAITPVFGQAQQKTRDQLLTCVDEACKARSSLDVTFWKRQGVCFEDVALKALKKKWPSNPSAKRTQAILEFRDALFQLERSAQAWQDFKSRKGRQSLPLSPFVSDTSELPKISRPRTVKPKGSPLEKSLHRHADRMDSMARTALSAQRRQTVWSVSQSTAGINFMLHSLDAVLGSVNDQLYDMEQAVLRGQHNDAQIRLERAASTLRMLYPAAFRKRVRQNNRLW